MNVYANTYLLKLFFNKSIDEWQHHLEAERWGAHWTFICIITTLCLGSCEHSLQYANTWSAVTVFLVDSIFENYYFASLQVMTFLGVVRCALYVLLLLLLLLMQISY